MGTKKKATTARQQLEAKRKALAAAERDLTAAEGTFDEHGVVEARNRVEVLRRFVARLVAAAADELEKEGARQAGQWLKNGAASRDAVDAISQAQAEARAAVKTAVAAIRHEAKLRRSLRSTALAVDVLRTRFPEVATKATKVPAPPAVEDYGRVVLEVVDGRDGLVAHNSGARRRLVLPRGASDTPEVTRRKTLDALRGFLGKHLGALPKDVQTIIRTAPLPEPAPTEAERRRADREAAQEAEEARTAELFGVEASRSLTRRGM